MPRGWRDEAETGADVAEFEQMTMSDGASVAVYRAQPTGERRGGVVLVQ